MGKKAEGLRRPGRELFKKSSLSGPTPKIAAGRRPKRGWLKKHPRADFLHAAGGWRAGAGKAISPRRTGRQGRARSRPRGRPGVCGVGRSLAAGALDGDFFFRGVPWRWIVSVRPRARRWWLS
jgi:hypothetical protein